MTRRHDPLREYRGKRDVRHSGEPVGRRRTERAAAPKFVVQHHRASTGHYDFRLEVDGEKLHGGFALTRIRDGKDETWLLVKRSDKHANKQPRRTTKSALSGRTLHQIEVDAR